MNDLAYKEFTQAKDLGNNLYDLASDFMTNFGLNQVFVGKFYFDGRYVDISNDVKWKEIMSTNHHFYCEFVKFVLSHVKTNTHKSFFITWESQPSGRDLLLDQTFDHGIKSGFNIFRIHSDHIENYGFGSSKGILELSHSLPNRDELEMLCVYLQEGMFKTDTCENLVLGNMGQSFEPPQIVKGYSHVPIPQSFSLFCNNCDAKLSRRELVCLGLLARGYSQKEMARIVKLSPRTIEFHLNHIKAKFNNPSKYDLITAFHASTLAELDPLMLYD